MQAPLRSLCALALVATALGCATGPRQRKTDVGLRAGAGRVLHVLPGFRAEKHDQSAVALRVRHRRPYGAFFEGELAVLRTRLRDAVGVSEGLVDATWSQLMSFVQVGFRGRTVQSQVGVTLLHGGATGVQPVPSVLVRAGRIGRIWAVAGAGCDGGPLEPCGLKGGGGLRVGPLWFEVAGGIAVWPGSVPVGGRRGGVVWAAELLSAEGPTFSAAARLRLNPTWAVHMTTAVGSSALFSAGATYSWTRRVTAPPPAGPRRPPGMPRPVAPPPLRPR